MLHTQAAERVLVDQFLAALSLLLRSFTKALNGMTATNHYEDTFARLIGDGVQLPAVIERVAGTCRDGKPLRVGKKKLTKRECDSHF